MWSGVREWLEALCWQAYVVAGEVDARGRACLAHIKEGGGDQGENDEEHLG